MLFRALLDGLAMILLIGLGVYLSTRFGDCAPMAMVSYLWGATADNRLMWIRTGSWTW